MHMHSNTKLLLHFSLQAFLQRLAHVQTTARQLPHITIADVSRYKHSAFFFNNSLLCNLANKMFFHVRALGFEPRTFRVSVECSTN